MNLTISKIVINKIQTDQNTPLKTLNHANISFEKFQNLKLTILDKIALKIPQSHFLFFFFVISFTISLPLSLPSLRSFSLLCFKFLQKLSLISLLIHISQRGRERYRDFPYFTYFLFAYSLDDDGDGESRLTILLSNRTSSR